MAKIKSSETYTIKPSRKSNSRMNSASKSPMTYENSI